MKYRLLFCCLCLIGVAKAQNFCADSSSHFKYSSLSGDRLTVEKTILLKDSSKLIVGSIIERQSLVRGFISKIDKNGFVAWFKKITAPYGNGETEIESVAEAANGNIFAATTSAQPDGKPYFLVVFFPNGEIVSEQKIGFSNIPFLGNRLVRIPLISQFGVDSMLINFYANPTASTEGELLTLCTTDNLGQPGQAYTFNAPIVTIRSSYFDKCRINANSIELFGVTEYWHGCLVNGVERPAFAYIKIDWPSKQVIAKKAFCTPPEGDGFGYFNSQYDAFPTNNGKHNIFLQANGHVLFTRSYMGLEYNRSDTTNRLFSVSEFDENFNHVKSEYITTDNQFKKDSYYELYIDSQNGRQVRIHDQPRGEFLYAVGNSSGFSLQKTIPFKQPIRNGKISRQSFIEPGYLTSFTIVSADSQYGYLDNFRIMAKDTAQDCFGNSTDFLSYKPASVSSMNWTGNFTIQKATIETAPTGFSLQDYPLQREIICNIVRRCDTLKINAPQAVCDLSQPIRITAHKNLLCPGPVQFVFDTAGVASYNQINDTALLLTFNKAWTGKIYACAAACNMLKDSVEVNVYSPSAALNLGNDTTLCKGTSLMLTAPPQFKQYQWQNGSNADTFNVSLPGEYILSATDYCGRNYVDTVQVLYSNSSLNLGEDINICLGEERALSSTSEYRNYYWQPNYNISSTGSNSPTVFPYQTTTYFVQARDASDCIVKDTILVRVDTCETAFFVPSAFTPNHDGKNDMFEPVVKGLLLKYQFSIYNRWGQLIFSTNKVNEGWNGEINNRRQTAGTYVWICSYQFLNGPPKQMKGTVLLIR